MRSTQVSGLRNEEFIMRQWIAMEKYGEAERLRKTKENQLCKALCGYSGCIALHIANLHSGEILD